MMRSYLCLTTWNFNDSIEKANADYEANKTYNPDVKLNYNIYSIFKCYGEDDEGC